MLVKQLSILQKKYTKKYKLIILIYKYKEKIKNYYQSIQIISNLKTSILLTKLVEKLMQIGVYYKI